MKIKILVADESSLVARTVAALVARFGYQVTASVSTGSCAMESATREPPHLALVDLHMGGDLSGVDLALRLIRRGVRVVFLTSLPADRADAIASEVGAHGLMPKPFGTREFRAGVEAALGPAGVAASTAS